jgi:signal transduction histidine kinase
LATSKLVKPHTPHPTPHTLPPPKNFLPQTLYKNVRHIAGTGLGLVVVQKCVELHGGSIEIANIPGNGTTVTILLPKVA